MSEVEEEQMDNVIDPQSVPVDLTQNKTVKIRNLVAFWLLGLCNNYAYVIMLSAAHDILGSKETVPENDIDKPDAMFNLTHSTGINRFDCNPVSTGAVLLADVLPTLFIKLSAPWFFDYIQYNILVGICIVTAVSSFLIVAFSHVLALSLLGVVFASVSSGLGEFTYVSLMAFYEKNVVSTWSSGTGAAGFIGSLAYAGLTEAGLSPRNSLLVMLVVPLSMIISYWGILVSSPTMRQSQDTIHCNEDRQCLIEDDTKDCKDSHLTVKEKGRFIKHLLKYMGPLFLVYFAEYFINQGLMELIYFKGIWLSHSAQYRWFQVLYQLGVFISRSSVNIVKFKWLWIFPILQWCVLILMFTVAYFAFMPTIFIVFAIIIFEGLLGGGAYVNTFYQIRQDVDPKYNEFALGTTTVADSAGVSLAGAVALPVHNALCAL
ncbi:battenin-like isoform X1 [Asterias rubens]|uniref:battenin-like isoform X1 n=2 Tax=Asterias rubens TaxID=7604 RepID=UPI001455700B|nr:battenin-like isoform X1 [Asterias rubens]